MKPNTYIASKDQKNLFFKGHFTYIASKTGNQPNIVSDPSGKDEILLPLNIFNNGLSGLEAISKYLKEINKLKYCEIAKLLNRDDRTIWDAYNGARQKDNEKFGQDAGTYSIPLNIFNNRKLSVLETLTTYLKEGLNLRYCQIASLLKKDPRTVWTAYSRGKKKRKNEYGA